LNAIALAGGWYIWFVGQDESEPGTPEHWRAQSDHLVIL
jgi:hypothetical protein